MKFDTKAQAATPPRPLDVPGRLEPNPQVVRDKLPDAQERTIPSGKNPERLAWLVLLGAFATCLVLTITIPLGVRYLLLYSTESQPGTLQAISLTTKDAPDTVRFTPPNSNVPIAVTEPTSLPENSVIETGSGQNSRAFLTLFDGSTVQVYPNSKLAIRELRRPRFSWSDLSNVIRIDQARGFARYGAAVPFAHPGNPDGRPVHFIVHTPQFDVWLNPGSYSIEVTDNGSQVSVPEGSAVVRALNGSRDVTVGQGQRLYVAKGQALADPVPAAQDLIKNADFSSNFSDADWIAYVDQGGDYGDVNGSVRVGTFADRRAVQIVRTGAGQNSAETGIKQQIDRDVSGYRSLIVSADIRVHNQTLPGGGYLSSEYPLIIRIKYRDVDGNEQEWVRGFYYQVDPNNPTPRNGEEIPRDTWVPIITGNLLEGLDPKPFRIVSIRIYASGWDYESYISGVHLTAE